MIDWQALGLAAVRTLWFMLAYFVGMMGLVFWQKYRKHTDAMRPWAVKFSVLMFVALELVMVGVVK